MSGPVPARGPCPHGVVDDVCYRCTEDTEVLRIAAGVLRGDVLTGKAYEVIAGELERIATELEELETELSARARKAAAELAGSGLGVYEPPAPAEDARAGDAWGPGASDYEAKP